MEKCCQTCKWYYHSQCNCKDLKSNINIDTSHKGVSYVEDGILAETIQENLEFSYIKDLIIDKLKDENYIKKNKNINKFDIENLEPEIVEAIDSALSESIMNYFENSEKSNINFNNTDKFYCYYWE